jgi:hypothetical protein
MTMTDHELEKNELRWHLHLAELEGPYVKGDASPGEDLARDAEVCEVARMLGAPCVLD